MPPILTKATQNLLLTFFQSPKAMQTLTCTQEGEGTFFALEPAGEFRYKVAAYLSSSLSIVSFPGAGSSISRRHGHRLPIALGSLALVCLAGMAPPVAGQTFPYRAYATTDNVYVRSGPGDNYYPTDKLKTGDAVEVYRHDPGGWYAIRPVAGSFSWVSGRYLQLGKDHLATVTEDHVAARVGSRFSDIRNVIQVRLHRGELVEVLDAQHTGQAASTPSNAWYKIAPPAGEFRWVSSKYLDTNSPRDSQLKKPSGSNTGGTPAPHTMSAAVPNRGQPDRLGPLDHGGRRAGHLAVWRVALAVPGTIEPGGDDSRSRPGPAAPEQGRPLRGHPAAHDRANTLHDTPQQTDRELRSQPAASPDLAATRPNWALRWRGQACPGDLAQDRGAAICPAGRVWAGAVLRDAGAGGQLALLPGPAGGHHRCRGFVPEQQTSHIMAQHINVVDSATLR